MATADPAPIPKKLRVHEVRESWTAVLDRLGDAFRMALIAMNAHKLRTVLTMLGIVIGIASVVSILSVIGGAQKAVLAGVGSLGSDTINIYPGQQAGDVRAAAVVTLRPEDAIALSRQPYVDSASPVVNSARTLRVGGLAERRKVAVAIGAHREDPVMVHVVDVEVQHGEGDATLGIARQHLRRFGCRAIAPARLVIAQRPARGQGVTTRESGVALQHVGVLADGHPGPHHPTDEPHLDIDRRVIAGGTRRELRVIGVLNERQGAPG